MKYLIFSREVFCELIPDGIEYFFCRRYRGARIPIRSLTCSNSVEVLKLFRKIKRNLNQRKSVLGSLLLF